MKYILVAILWCFVIAVKSFGQATDKVIDSLQTELSKADADTSKVLILIQLGIELAQTDKQKAYEYLKNARKLSQQIDFLRGEILAITQTGRLFTGKSEVKKAIKLLEEGVLLAEKADIPDEEMQLFNMLGATYYSISDYDNSLKYFSKGLKVAEKSKNLVYQGMFVSNIGVIYDEQGSYPQALNFYFKGLRLAESQNDQETKVAILINISTIYSQQKNYKFAIQKTNEALALIKPDMKEALSSQLICYGNLADFYFEKKNSAKQQDYDKSLNYAQQSLTIAEKIKDQLGIVNAYRAIGKVKKAENDFQGALKEFDKALAISKSINDKQGALTVEREMAYTYTKLKNVKKALTYAQSSLNDALKIGAAKDVKDGYKILSDVYLASDQIDSSFYYYKKFTQLKDSLSGEKIARDFANIRAGFELEKKEAQIILLKKDSDLKAANVKRQRIIRNFFIAGFVIILILAFVLYRSNLQKQRSNQLLQNKNEEINRKNVQINAQNEAITSSINYAQRIQKAILPLEERIASVVEDHFIFHKPKDIVSGDFYWFIEYQDKYFISVVDCTGHGVPGAFMSMLGNTSLTNIVLQQGITKPHEILNQLSKEVDFILQQHVTQNTDSMDMAMCVIDPQNKVLEYAGANNPLIYIQDNTMNLIKADRMPIGKEQIDMAKSYTLHTIDICEPTTVYMFSDGFQDQFGGKDGKKFRSSKLRELLNNIHHHPMDVQKIMLEQTMNAWMGDGEKSQIDDMLIMGIKVDTPDK